MRNRERETEVELGRWQEWDQNKYQSDVNGAQNEQPNDLVAQYFTSYLQSCTCIIFHWRMHYSKLEWFNIFYEHIIVGTNGFMLQTI